MPYLALYLAAISPVAIILTIHDKHAARKRQWRTRENTLLLVSALGGSVAMLVTMLLIRHKTRHARFMVGIPIIIVLQVALAAAVVWLRMKGGAA